MAEDTFNTGAIEIPVTLKLDEAQASLDGMVSKFKETLDRAVTEALEKIKEVKVDAKVEVERKEERSERPLEREAERPRVVEVQEGKSFSVMPDRVAEKDLDKMELRNLLQQIRDNIEQLVALQTERS